MRSYFTHTLEPDREKILSHGPSECLAIVDLESYPSYISKDADHLDMMAHLQRQMSALTITAWGVPKKELNLRLVLAEDHLPMEHLIESHQNVSASGWVRTHGQLCLTNGDRLYDCAQEHSHDLLRGKRLPEFSRPHVLNVPPGIYSIHIFHHFPEGEGIEENIHPAPKAHSTIILRHYAFPAPRLTPMRLPAFMPQAA